MESLVLAVNPGSASKKYALYKKNQLIAAVHFECVGDVVICDIRNDKRSVQLHDVAPSLDECSNLLMDVLRRQEFVAEQAVIAGIGMRVVAPSGYFLQNRFLDAEALAMLETQQAKAPLHIGTTLAELKKLQAIFTNIPIFLVSDSAFHASKPDVAWNYGISLDIADKHDIKRFGYHGISVESIVQKLAQTGQLEDKVIVCHLGSGSSVTAVRAGKSIDTTMGYSPLEGVLMATRSGSIDLTAAHELKKQLALDDAGLELLLNKSSGLLGISGFSNDIRELLEAEQAGNHRAHLALDMYCYAIKKAIGQMASILGGVDTLVFTGTIGARSAVMRRRIGEGFEFLNFAIQPSLNDAVYEPQTPTKINPRTRQKNIFVVTTDESFEIALRTTRALKNNA